MVTKPGIVRYLPVAAVFLSVLFLPGCVQGPGAPPALLPPGTPADSASPTLCSSCTQAPTVIPPSGAHGTPVSIPPFSQGTPADSVSPTGTIPAQKNQAGAVPFVPGRAYHVGESILFEGTTILSPGNPLLIEVKALSFVPTNKTDRNIPSGASAVIEVQLGSIEGQNTWQFLLSTSGMAPGDYSFEIAELEVQGFRSSAGFSLVP